MAPESTGFSSPDTRRDLPHSIHFVGIGGIGMSGLAQMFADLGCTVTGSDRALGHPENERIFAALRKCGARLFPQDGSAYADGYMPDAIVYSTAIEGDNPDFKLAPPGTRRLHRSEALELGIGALRERFTVAVTGTCGKTTVSAWLADALDRLGGDPGMLSGGYVKRFLEDGAAGNYRGGLGRDFVIEADESDKSLLNYVPDTALILNIGTDHYSREELAGVFLAFAASARSCVVMELAAFKEIGPEKFPAGKMVLLFSGDPDAPVSYAGRRVLRLNTYRVADGSAWCAFNGLPEIRLPMPGRHNALNALAVHTVLTSRGYDPMDALKAVSEFAGVARRFDRAGVMENGAQVIDDYAHNVEKLASCIGAAQELAPEGRVVTVFQPHGFAPLRFMREALANALPSILRPTDEFLFLPVYYAGGTTSFSPTSAEVAATCREAPGVHADAVKVFEDRLACEKHLKNTVRGGDVVIVAGARDESLSIWAKSLTKHA
jgi:UDP-N-acetylmuramate--alanine ligase